MAGRQGIGPGGALYENDLLGLVRSAPYIGQRRPVTSHRWSLPWNPATCALSDIFLQFIITTKQLNGWRFYEDIYVSKLLKSLETYEHIKYDYLKSSEKYA